MAAGGVSVGAGGAGGTIFLRLTGARLTATFLAGFLAAFFGAAFLAAFFGAAFLAPFFTAALRVAFFAMTLRAPFLAAFLAVVFLAVFFAAAFDAGFLAAAFAIGMRPSQSFPLRALFAPRKSDDKTNFVFSQSKRSRCDSRALASRSIELSRAPAPLCAARERETTQGRERGGFDRAPRRRARVASRIIGGH